MAKEKTILCYGDSNTHGTVPSLSRGVGHRYPPSKRWTGILRKRLGAGWEVLEEGLGGRTTVHDDPIEGAHLNGARALPISLESHMPLDLVILSLGVNDLKHRFAATPDDIADSIEVLVNMIKRSGAGHRGASPQVLIISPAPIHEVDRFSGMFSGGRGKSLELAGLFAQVATRNDVGFLDAGKVVTASVVDGIHMEEEGHRALGNEVAKLVNTLIA
jgi:lysophospholipase L1-like esterase